MSNILQQAALIVLIGAFVGVAGNQTSPRGIPLIAPPKIVSATSEFITLEEAKALWLGGASVFLDAREPVDFLAGHIGNAFNLPAQSFEQHFGEVAPMLSPGSGLVLYCDGRECELSHRLQASLHQLGYKNTHILFNGWSAWREAGLPTAQGGLR